MKMLKARKGFGMLNQLPQVFLIFGVAIIIASIVSQITGQVRATQTSQSFEYNISTYGLQGQVSAAQWFTTIGLIIGAVVVLSALFMLMMNRRD